jgi:hypothetical protein
MPRFLQRSPSKIRPCPPIFPAMRQHIFQPVSRQAAPRLWYLRRQAVANDVVVKIFCGGDDPEIILPFDDRPTAWAWVQANAWRAPYQADRVELHEVDAADRSTALALAEKNAGGRVEAKSRTLTEIEQEQHERKRASSFFRNFVKALKETRGDFPTIDFTMISATLWMVSALAIGWISPKPLPSFIIGAALATALVVGVVLHWHR